MWIIAASQLGVAGLIYARGPDELGCEKRRQRCSPGAGQVAMWIIVFPRWVAVHLDPWRRRCSRAGFWIHALSSSMAFVIRGVTSHMDRQGRGRARAARAAERGGCRRGASAAGGH